MSHARVATIILFLLTGLGYLSSMTSTDIEIILLCVVLLNATTLRSITTYGARDILTLTTAPKSKHKITGSLKLLMGNHILDLILVPAMTMLIAFSVYSQYFGTPDTVTMFTMGTTILTATQIIPLKIQKDRFAKAAHSSISNSIRSITIARKMLEGLDRNTAMYSTYIKMMSDAEQVIRLSCDFLTMPGGTVVTLISTIRFLTPVFGTMISILTQFIPFDFLIP